MSQELVPISQNSSICLGTYTLGNWALEHGSLALVNGCCTLGPRILALGPGSFNLDLIINCKIRVITCPGE